MCEFPAAGFPSVSGLAIELERQQPAISIVRTKNGDKGNYHGNKMSRYRFSKRPIQFMRRIKHQVDDASSNHSIGTRVFSLRHS